MKSLRHILVAATPAFLIIVLMAGVLLISRLVVWYSDSKKKEEADKKAAEVQREIDAKKRATDYSLRQMGINPVAIREAEQNSKLFAQLKGDIESLPEGLERDWKLHEVEIERLIAEMRTENSRMLPLKRPGSDGWSLETRDVFAKRSPAVNGLIAQMEEQREKQKAIEVHLGEPAVRRFEAEIEAAKTKAAKTVKKADP